MNDEEPDVSIFLVEISGREGLAGCLKAFSDSCYPVTVLCREHHLELEKVYSDIEFVCLDAPIPEKRCFALTHSSADVVLIVEDTTRPLSKVDDALADFHRREDSGMVGPIYVADDVGARERSLVLLEYSPSIYSRSPPSDAAVGSMLGRITTKMPGNVLCYKRKKVEAVRCKTETGLYENLVNQRLSDSGESFLFVEHFQFEYAGEDVSGCTLSTRFQHGRLYAGCLSVTLSTARRFFGILKSPIVPFLFCFRVHKNLCRNKFSGVSFSVWWWMFLFSVAWASGELTGYLFGEGNSLESWK